MKEKPFKMPKSLAACADLLFTTRQARLEIQKQVDAHAKMETILREHLINELPKGEASGIQGKLARASVVLKVKPTVEDWPALYAYVKKTGNFDMLQRRLSDTAVKERWEDGKEVPGVGKFQYADVSVNKV